MPSFVYPFTPFRDLTHIFLGVAIFPVTLSTVIVSGFNRSFLAPFANRQQRKGTRPQRLCPLKRPLSYTPLPSFRDLTHIFLGVAIFPATLSTVIASGFNRLISRTFCQQRND